MAGLLEDMADDAYWDPITRQIITTDMLVEGQHFKLDYFSAEDLGWKAAAVNISDIAGMGGQPQSLLVSLGLPEHISTSWVEQFYQGLLSACKTYNCRLVGGDTVGSPILILNGTAIGVCPEHYSVGRRTQAKAGDIIIATGYHGLSEVGLKALQEKSSNYPFAQKAHLTPYPHVEEGLLLAKRFFRYALMDSSDGLADALIKIGLASDKKLIVNAAKIPLHPEVKGFAQSQGLNPIELALYGGEDFQLVATVPECPPDLLAHFHVLGTVEASQGKPGAWLQTPGVEELTELRLEKTYQHFGKEPAHG